MKQKNHFLKRTLSCVLVIIMALTSAPMSDFSDQGMSFKVVAEADIIEIMN